MSAAREILPGSTYVVTRRCSERRFFLRPDSFVTKTFLFCIAFAAVLFGMRIHGYIVLSNHWNCILTDPRARLPDFMREVHRLVAKSVNCFRGRWESLWSSERYGKVRLETPDDALGKLIYVLANAVSAGFRPQTID